MDYWKEAVSEAFDAAGITATDEQITEVASQMEGAHECYGQAMGFDVATANYHAQQRDETERLKKELQREKDKVPCKACAGKRVPTLNGNMMDAMYVCDVCDRTGKVDYNRKSYP